MVVADAGPDRLDVRQVADDRVPEPDVLLDDRVLVGRQRRRLAQDRVRDPDLADVVEESRQLDRATLLGGEPKEVGQEHGVPGDVLGMLLRVAVLGIDGSDETGQNLEARALGDGQIVRRDVRHPDRVPAAALGLGQGPGGDRQQLGGGLAVRRRVAGADADRDREPLGPVELEAQLGDPGSQPIDRRLEVVDALRWGDDDELVRAIAPRRGRQGQLLAQDAGDVDERPVAAVVAVGLVDEPEVVDVEQGDPHGGAREPCALEERRQLGHGRPVIEEAGQRVTPAGFEKRCVCRASRA